MNSNVFKEYFYKMHGKRFLLILLMALLFGCTEETKDEGQNKTINKVQKKIVNDPAQEKAYKDKLLSYNAQISARMEKIKAAFEEVNKSEENEANGETNYIKVAPAMNAHLNDFNEEAKAINELVKKRNKLKLTVIDQFGALPEWWVETKSLPEN
jgi:hypothetical protein